MSEDVLLIGHGSARYPDAGGALSRHAAALAATGQFRSARHAVLAGRPLPAEALAACTGRVVHVVPVFMEQGYFASIALPRALAGATPAGGGQVRLHPALGTRPEIAELIARRVRAGCKDPTAVGLVLLGHGSTRAPGRAEALHRHAATLRDNGFERVETAFLEEAPDLLDAIAALGARPAAVVGLFTGEGAHVRDDVPALLAEARRRHGAPVHDLGFLGDDPGLPDIVMEMVAAAGG